jgi:hypothetical protein
MPPRASRWAWGPSIIARSAVGATPRGRPLEPSPGTRRPRGGPPAGHGVDRSESRSRVGAAPRGCPLAANRHAEARGPSIQRPPNSRWAWGPSLVSGREIAASRCVRLFCEFAQGTFGSADRGSGAPRGGSFPAGHGVLRPNRAAVHPTTGAYAGRATRARWRPRAGGRSAGGRGTSGGYGPPPASPCRRRRRRRRPGHRRSPAASPARPP